MQKITPEMIQALLARDGSIQVGPQALCYFRNKFVYEENGIRRSFDTLEEVACYIAFSNKVFVEAKVNDDRFEWFVLDNQSVYGKFPRKHNALSFCMRVTVDRRRAPRMQRMGKGLYNYLGPRHDDKQFYVGLRDALIHNGFDEIIERWEKNATVL